MTDPYDEPYDWYFARGPMVKGLPSEEARRKAMADAVFSAHARADLPRLLDEVERLRAGIRRLRDEWLRGDDKCWKDLETCFALLPEGYTPPARDTCVELENCKRYIASCHDPRVQYTSPQRRIEELESEVEQLRGTAYLPQNEVKRRAIGGEA